MKRHRHILAWTTLLAVSLLIVQGEESEPAPGDKPAASEPLFPADKKGPGKNRRGPGQKRADRPDSPPADLNNESRPKDRRPPRSGERLADIPKSEEISGFEGQPLHMLEKMLELSPEELKAIRVSIQRLENMSPEERDALRQRIRNFRNMQKTERDKIMRTVKRISPQDRKALLRYWSSLSPEEAKAQRDKMSKMTPEERAAFRLKILEEARRKDQGKRK